MKKSELRNIIREELGIGRLTEATLNSSSEIVELNPIWKNISKADDLVVDAIGALSSFWMKEEFSDKDSKKIKTELEKVKEEKKKFFAALENFVTNIANSVKTE